MDQLQNQDPHRVVFSGLKKLVSKLYSVVMVLYQRTEELEKIHHEHCEEFEKYIFNNEAKLEKLNEKIELIKERQDKNMSKIGEHNDYIETQKMRIGTFAWFGSFLKNNLAWIFSILGTAMGGLILWLNLGQFKIKILNDSIVAESNLNFKHSMYKDITWLITLSK